MFDLSSSMVIVVKAVVVFVSTNVDDIVLLAVLFADPKLRPRNIVLGQFLGIFVLVAASSLAGMAAGAVPAGWTSLLGAIPLGLGVWKGIALLRAKNDDDDNAEKRHGESGLAQIVAVAGVTIANGGDNLGVYIPLFAVERGAIPVYALVFAALTAVWCVVGYKLVTNRAVGERLRRYGHIALPIVLIALGLHILAGARVLL